MGRLFVYGTLAPGRSNHHVLAGLEGSWQPAAIRGILHPEGWGAALGYPAVVLDPQAGWVEGQVFSSRELERAWRRLDAFEGSAYRRVKTTARLSDGRQVECFVYELAQAGVQR
ncbi:MAG: gamma-glutamylcyclotransferase family protein [Xanthomonadales bacterium]|nr:gamma-glutamylcyclotransferase family protein [Xanthomonadales bacterium]